MVIKEDKSMFLDYLKDASNYQGDAEKLFIVENKDDIIEIVKNANISKANLSIQGARTGLTGGAIPNSGYIISTEKLNKHTLNIDEKTIWVEPGLKYFELNDILKEVDLFFPPNPTETSSSIGGNVGTNASGSRTFQYGATRNWVEEIKVILPNGEDFHLKRGQFIVKDKIEFLNYSTQIKDIKMPTIKHAAGYYIKPNMDLIDLFIGSEGTLGIIYDIKLRLLEIPKHLIGLIVFFKNKKELFDFLGFTRDSNNSLISPRLIEYFDKNSLNVLKKHYSQLKDDFNSAIWVEQEVNDELMDKSLEEWYNLIENTSSFPDATWIATEDKQHHEFARFRHKLPEEVYEHLTGNNTFKIGTDTAVESHLFEAYYDYLYNELEKLELDYLVFGHIGNSHLHANIFYKNQEEMKLAKEFYMRLIKKTVSMGGTVSAEHGIGKIKKEYLYEMFPNDIELMRNIKQTLDPNLILSPDNLFY